MARLAGWLGTGVLTAGVSAALLAGAGTAHADTETGSDSGASSTSASSDAGSDSATTPKRGRGLASGEATDSDKPASARPGSRRGDSADSESADPDSQRSSRDSDEQSTTEATPEDDEETVATKRRSSRVVEHETGTQSQTETQTESESVAGSGTEPEFAAVSVDVEPGLAAVVVDEAAEVETEAEPTAAETPVPGVATVDIDGTAPAGDAQPAQETGHLLGPFQPDYPPLVRILGSAVFNVIGTLVQVFDGPPVVPRDLRDSIQVSSSTLVVTPGTEVAADWYFPVHGEPQRLIYLQHGVLASSPMYSYTASYLAQRTNSVVIATTLTSNPFADGNLWLGGDAMHRAVAQLLLDENREALNASLTTATLKAGRVSLTVPTEFVLVGHSLGGGFAPGVAGHYAEGLVARRADGHQAANHAAGVVLLDGVPFSPIMPNALGRMQQLEQSNNGDPADYLPVYQIGAPLNFLNANSAVNEELSVARPGRFNGVVIDRGVHMDGMLGGNPLIQFAAYLAAGFPIGQNPSAVQLLMAGWINDMFAGDVDPVLGRCVGDDCVGVYGDPGEAIAIPAENGEASAVVIDSGPAGLPQLRPRLIPLRSVS